MADQNIPPTEGATAPKPEAASVQPQGGSQVPLPSLVPGGAFSPTTEKQVSDLLAEMQQYASTAAPGTTTTMQFSYSKTKHSKETSGQEPQVVESSHVEKSVHQTPPPEQKPQQQPEASHGTSIFSQIPQFLQEKLGFGGGAAPQQQGGQQHTEVSYHHSKKTTTTTTTSSSGGEQKTVTTTETQDYPLPQPAAHTPTPPPQPAQEPQQQQPQAEPAAQEGGLLAPLKNVAEKLQEQVAHIPQLLQETFGHQTTTEEQHHQEQQQQKQQQQQQQQQQEHGHQEGGQQVEINYQHSKKTTTTTSTSSSSGDQHQGVTTVSHQQAAPQDQEGIAKPVSVSPLTSVFPHPPSDGNVHIEVSKHSSRQMVSQSGELPPHIETSASGYTQVIQGIFNGVPVNGGVVPAIVSLSVKKSGTDSADTGISQVHTHDQHAAPPPPSQPAAPQPAAAPESGTTSSTTTSGTATIDATAQLEEQLKKLGLAAGHPVSELLQQTLSQHQRAKTPESNIEIQYSAQRTHSSRTVTYEASGADPTAAREALQQLQSSLSTVSPPSQEPQADSSQQNEYVEGTHIDEDGNLVITKKITRVTTTTRTVYDEGGQPTADAPQAAHTPEHAGDQPPATQGFFGGSQPLIRLKINRAVFKGILDKDQHIQLVPISK